MKRTFLEYFRRQQAHLTRILRLGGIVRLPTGQPMGRMHV